MSRRLRVLFMLVTFAFALSACTSPTPSDATLSDDAEVPLAWPSQGQAAIGLLEAEGGVSRGAETAVPMASLTKVVTALVVLDEHPLAADDDGPDIEFTPQDVEANRELRRQNAVIRSVESGDAVSQRELLRGMLIASVSTDSEKLASWAFGDSNAFLEAAQRWAEKHELEHMRIADASGLDPASVATASELLKVARLALNNEAIAQTVALPTVSIGDRVLENSNGLLIHVGYRGVKTGNLLGTSSLMFARDIDVDGETVTLVGVVMQQHNDGYARQSAMSLADSALAQLQARAAE